MFKLVITIQISNLQLQYQGLLTKEILVNICIFNRKNGLTIKKEIHILARKEVIIIFKYQKYVNISVGKKIKIL